MSSELQPVRQNLEQVLSNFELGFIVVVLMRVLGEAKQTFSDRGEDGKLCQGCHTVEISLISISYVPCFFEGMHAI